MMNYKGQLPVHAFSRSHVYTATRMHDAHDPLAAHVIQKLRDIAGKPQPAFRKRVRSVVFIMFNYLLVDLSEVEGAELNIFQTRFQLSF